MQTQFSKTENFWNNLFQQTMTFTGKTCSSNFYSKLQEISAGASNFTKNDFFGR